MTEREWLTLTDPLPLLSHLRGRASSRKLRLFAVACARHIEHRIRDDRFRTALDLAERLADQDEPLELARQFAELQAVYHRTPYSEWETLHRKAAWAALDCLDPDAYSAASGSSIGTGWATSPFDSYTSRTATALLRDIFGNPFRPVRFSPEWRTDTAVALARQMYESRDFGAMPILADAIQDAGCNDEQILMHCRGPGPHVRGCWVVDLVLGKQ